MRCALGVGRSKSGSDKADGPGQSGPSLFHFQRDRTMKTISYPSSLILLQLAAVLASVQASPWPAWRGAHGTGVSQETQLPLHWDRTNNVRWKAPLPEPGNSTPVVWGGRVFVTQAVDKEQRRSLMCFDRA